MATSKKIFNNVRKLISLNKITDAKITLQPLITRNYNDYTLHLLLGIIYHIEDNFDKATISYKKALELNPENIETLLNFSILYYDIGKYDDAKNLFEQASSLKIAGRTEEKNIEKDVDNLLARQHVEIAKLYIRYKRYEEALHELRKASNLDKSIEDIGLLRAECVYENGEPERAVLLLSKLKMQNPDFLDLRIKLGLYFYRLGDKVSAISEWEKVLSLDPNNIEAKHFLNMQEDKNLEIN